ncbi:unnamed protein product [Alopecurus aequalis]
MSMSAILSALRGAGRRQITASTVAARQATGSHVLRIDGYTRVVEKAANGTSVASGAFSVGGHDWRIRCYPNGDLKPGYMALFLCHASHAKTGDATAMFTMSILDKAWKPSSTRTIAGEHRFKDPGQPAYGWENFVQLQDLDKEMHLKDDCLSILCDVTVDLGLRTDDYTDGDGDGIAVAEEPTAGVAAPPFDLLGEPLADSIWNNHRPDVTVHVDGQTFAAHRWVLESRSPVFKADFALAPTNREIRIDDMDADVCKALLQFIYTNSPPPELESAALAERLLVAADRYGLEKLKLVCEEALCKNMGTSSVAAALALAERHRCPVLREACIRFLSSQDNLDAVVALSDGSDRLQECPSALLELLKKKNSPQEEEPIDPALLARYAVKSNIYYRNC